MSKKPTFPDFVEISPVDTLREPRYPTQKIMNFIFWKVKYICATCHDYITPKLIKDKVKGDCFTTKCKCGCTIIYPSSDRRNGARLVKFIPKDNYVRAKRDTEREV